MTSHRCEAEVALQAQQRNGVIAERETGGAVSSNRLRSIELSAAVAHYLH